jgi:hypothetical protein
MMLGLDERGCFDLSLVNKPANSRFPALLAHGLMMTFGAKGAEDACDG